MVEPREIDLIKVSIPSSRNRATVHRTVAFKLFDSHRLNTYTKIKVHPVGWTSILVEPMGIELIKDRLGQALAGGAHPRRIKLVRFPYPTLPIIKPPKRVVLLLVEPMGIEPMSESNLEGTSPGAVCYLHSLIPAGTNTLRESVAS